MKKMKLLKTEGESFSTLSREQLKSVFGGGDAVDTSKSYSENKCGAICSSSSDCDSSCSHCVEVSNFLGKALHLSDMTNFFNREDKHLPVENFRGHVDKYISPKSLTLRHNGCMNYHNHCSMNI